MAEKSLTQYAYDVLVEAKAPVAFIDLWNACLTKANYGELSEEQLKTMMSRFYTSLSVDGKFFCLTNNHWDLRSRYKFDDVHVDIEEAYSDDDVSEEKAEDNDIIPDELKTAELSEEDEDDGSDIDYDHPNKVIDDEF